MTTGRERLAVGTELRVTRENGTVGKYRAIERCNCIVWEHYDDNLTRLPGINEQDALDALWLAESRAAEAVAVVKGLVQADRVRRHSPDHIETCDPDIYLMAHTQPTRYEAWDRALTLVSSQGDEKGGDGQ